MRDFMVLNVKNALKNPGEVFPLEVSLTFPEEDFQGTVIYNEPAVFKGSYCCIGGNIQLNGEVTASLTLVCSRCLEDFVQPVACQVEEVFSHQPTDDMLPITAADTVDVGECVHSSILMSLELLRICSPECKGLCPVCGVNRNEVSCSCSQSEPQKDNPFAALQGLLDNEEV